jgi:hypothetical protein
MSILVGAHQWVLHVWSTPWMLGVSIPALSTLLLLAVANWTD